MFVNSVDELEASEIWPKTYILHGTLLPMVYTPDYIVDI